MTLEPTRASCATCGQAIVLTGRRRPLWVHLEPSDHAPALRTWPGHRRAAFEELLDAAIDLKRLLDKIERRLASDSVYRPYVNQVETVLERLAEVSMLLTDDSTPDEFRTAEVEAHTQQFVDCGDTPTEGCFSHDDWREARLNEFDAVKTQIEVFLLPELEAVLAGDQPLSIDLDIDRTW